MCLPFVAYKMNALQQQKTLGCHDKSHVTSTWPFSLIAMTKWIVSILNSQYVLKYAAKIFYTTIIKTFDNMLAPGFTFQL